MDYLDKLGDFAVLGVIGGITWLWNKVTGTDKKIADLALKIAENYVTKPELERMEDKIDSMGDKIDTVNQNVLLILTKKE